MPPIDDRDDGGPSSRRLRTRRALLRIGAAAGLGALAGCAGEEDGSGSDDGSGSGEGDGSGSGETDGEATPAGDGSSDGDGSDEQDRDDTEGEPGGDEPEPSDASWDGFVETDGAHFVVDGEPAYFNGSNNFWLTHVGSETRVDRVFEHCSELGIDLVRTWAFGEGRGQLQPRPGEHDEEELAHLDYVVESAREHGIRLVLALVNNWEDYGGMLQYAEWTGGETRHHFYTDAEARELYRNHVETILTRENSISGRTYRDDRTIAIWELANEPRLETDDTPDGEFDRDAGEHRAVLGQWVEEMAAYVKELDDDHLVSTGSEGHYYGGFDDPYPDGNCGGQDYLAHHDVDAIDACSFHWYPDHWDLPLDRGSDWIRTHVDDAHDELGKPAYLGEFNVHADHGVETRNRYLEEWYGVADEVDCDAALVWQVVLPETSDHDGFQVYAEESGDPIEAYGDVTEEKSGGS